MAITPIDVVIDPPLPTDAPSIFDQKAFAAWAAINGWAEQANALAVQVNTAADRVNDPSVQAVADNIADVMAVAGIEASVTIVATNSANVAAVAGNETNINAVNANKPNIDAVAGNKTNIDTVAGIAADVTAVASIDDDVSAVAGAAADVSTVATNISDVQAAAADMAAIKAAPGAANTASSAASTATTKAGEASASALAAAGSASTASTKASEASGHADRAEQAAEDADDILQQVLAHGNGWTPVLAMASDGERRVVQVTDWTGGQGTKPATGYLGATGVVSDIAQAIDVRGAPGSGSVSSVNSIEPDGNGNVDLGISDIPGLEDALDNAGQVKTVAGKGPDGSGDVSLGISDIPGLEDALDDKVDKSGLATVATTGSYDDLTDKPTLGTAATKNAPASGNAAAGEVVLGSDTRLTNARTPTAHTHAAEDVTGLATVATSGSYNDLTNKPSIPAGTVTSVGMSVPTGLQVSGSPVTSSGTLAVSFASGYAIPTTAKQSNWDTAYGWGNHASAGYAPTASPTFTGTVTLPATVMGDAALTRAMLKDCGFTYYNSGSTSSLNYTNGSHQRWAPSGSATLSVSNWPPSGNLGELLIEGINLGAATITWPTIQWVLDDGSTSTIFADTEVELQTSGTDWILLWTRDAGTTVYGKVMR